MLKVLIVDDEEKICELIERLIDWKSMNLEVMGKILNGLEAIEKVKEIKPEIVITDIRMPGISGIDMIAKIKNVSPETECIIISGYRYFEYAQSALQYGVRHYLLKPIKKDELKASLERIIELYKERHEQLSFEERVRLVMKNDEGKLRSGFMSKLVYGHFRGDGPEMIGMLNDHYHFEFRQGCFQVAAIIVDHIKGADEHLRIISDKETEIMQKHFREICYDTELYAEGLTSYVLLNYAPDERRNVLKAFRQGLEELRQESKLRCPCEITIGIGKPVEGIHLIRESLTSARYMIQQRLIRGTGLVIAENDLKNRFDIMESEVVKAFSRNFERALESLDVLEVRRVLMQLKEQIIMESDISGHEIIQLTKEVCNEYVFNMNTRKMAFQNRQTFIDQFGKKSEECATVDELFRRLSTMICESFKQSAEAKKAEDNRPIRIVKEYIKEHYKSQITLDEVSQLAGFTANYFSTLFKKETGQSFLEYLQEVRMEEAKKLLVESNDPISIVSEKVGYYDVKYFTKCFVKSTGLKPGEYRKIYS